MLSENTIFQMLDEMFDLYFNQVIKPDEDYNISQVNFFWS